MSIFHRLECFLELGSLVVYGLFPSYPDSKRNAIQKHSSVISRFVRFELQIFLNLNKRIYLGISVTYDRNTRLVTCANNSQHKVHFNFSRIQPRYSTKPRSFQIISGHLRSSRTFCSGIHIIIYTKYKINNARRKFDRYQTRITAGGLRREIRCDTYQ